jgi:hypothetical protein
VAKENDDDADRDSESNGEVHERWEGKGEISQKVKADAPWLDLGEKADNPVHKPRYDGSLTSNY